MLNPSLGPVSPTPAIVYDARIFSVRVWMAGGPFEGTGFLFKAPYGTSIMAAEILARAAARRQITRFTFGAASKTRLRLLAKPHTFERFDVAFERIGLTLGIDWAA